MNFFLIIIDFYFKSPAWNFIKAWYLCLCTLDWKQYFLYFINDEFILNHLYYCFIFHVQDKWFNIEIQSIQLPNEQTYEELTLTCKNRICRSTNIMLLANCKQMVFSFLRKRKRCFRMYVWLKHKYLKNTDGCSLLICSIEI